MRSSMAGNLKETFLEIREATGSLVESSNEMKATVGALTAAAQKLRDELEKFTV